MVVADGLLLIMDALMMDTASKALQGESLQIDGGHNQHLKDWWCSDAFCETTRELGENLYIHTFWVAVAT